MHGSGEAPRDVALVHIAARREFTIDHSMHVPPLLRSGWAAEQLVLPDGRRQVTGLFLPGERVIPSTLAREIESVSLLAVTPLELAYAVEPPGEHELAGLRGEMDDRLSQCFHAIVRLGCLDAYEKTANLLLEIAERMDADRGQPIDFPLTQELLADLLGLSQVHVNRTLQQLRRDQLIELQSGRLTILRCGLLRTAAQYGASALPGSSLADCD